MSTAERPYNPTFIKAWTLFSIVLAVIFFAMFVLGDHLLNAGRSVWDLIRWLASPII